MPPLAFGPFVLDRAGGRLLRDGAELPLAPRPHAVLAHLVAKAGQLVGKDELLDAVWGHRHVTETVLKSTINTLRAALGDDARAPRWIVTVPRRGYRFEAGEVIGAAAWAPGPRPGRHLPQPPTSLVGRESALAELLALMGDHRLVTLAGPGGVGKTRLALAAAAQAPLPADGIWFVGLEALAADADAASHLLAALAGTLRLTAESAGSAEALSASMARLELLLVLDNAEHLVAPLSTLARRLLDAAPGLRLLVTSQEPLHLAGEQLLRLAPLSVPADPQDREAQAHGAVALFVQRVRALQPEFTLDDANRPAVCQLCAALDGLPLALELAAARVPLLGVHGVQQRLAERLALLTQGPRDAVPRHRTLRAALAWSHGLLQEPERIVLRRLSVFAGSFSLEAAQQVAADAGASDAPATEPPLDEWVVLAALDTLADKSLLVPLRGAGPQRLRLYDSIRSFAAEQLQAAGERIAVQHRHAQWVRRRFTEAVRQAHDVPQLDWLAGLAPELDNLRAALHHLLQHDPPQAAALYGDAALFLQRAGLKHEGWRWHEAMREVPGERLDAATRAALNQAQAVHYVYSKLGVPTEALAAAQRAVAAHEALGDGVQAYFDHYLHWHVLIRLDPRADRGRIWPRMVALERPDWGALRRRYGRWLPALALRDAGDAESYRRFCIDERAAMQQVGDRHNVWVTTYALALAEHDAGRPAAALAVLDEAAGEVIALDHQRQQANLIGLWGALHLVHGDQPNSATAARDAIAMCRADSTLWWMAPAFPHGALRQGRLHDAARLQGWADALVRRVGEAPGILFSRLRRQAAEALAAALAPEDLAALQQAGAGLDEGAAIALALGPAASR